MLERVSTFLLMLLTMSLTVVLTLGCRIEKRVLEAGVPDPQNLTFQFSGTEPGMNREPAQSWSVRKFGQGTALITPPNRSALAGFGGLGRRLLPPRLYRGDEPTVFCRPFEKIESEPRIKVALYQGEALENYMIVSLDLVAVTQDLSQWLLDFLRNDPAPSGASAVQSEWSLANVQFVATHTHSGPAGLSLSPLWGAFACDSFQASYRLRVGIALREALAQARASLQDVAEVTVHRANLPAINASRISGMGVNSEVVLWTPRASSGRILGCHFSVPIHSTFYGPNSLSLSRDLAGWLETAMARKLGVSECFFMNGSSGNARAELGGKSPEDYAGFVSESFVAQAQPSLELENPAAAVGAREGRQPSTLRFAARSYELPEARINFKACGASGVEQVVKLPILEALPRVSKLGMVSIGEDLMVFVPGEIVYEVALELEKRIKDLQSVSGTVSFVSTSNDYVGYVLPGNWYGKRTLESCSSLYGQSHAEVLETATADLSAVMFR